MPNGHGPKKYGPHQYAEHGTSDCAFGCGCWAGDTRSGGPPGMDPLGACPKNPEDGKLLGGQQDIALVINQRIADLSSHLYQAQEKLKRVDPTRLKLAEELGKVREELWQKNQLLENIQKLLDQDKSLSKPNQESP